ncbi:hypothetical protein QTP86_002776 [Hemibagrus guttatus]|nr:hypothetical protein QTP86_002776 [Hemibagrus guttatus]
MKGREVEQGEEVKKVQEFKYLGSTVQSNGECGKEVKKQVQAGWNGWRKVLGVLCDRKISARIKGKVYRTVVRPDMLYGLETVSLKKRQESELEVAELKMLRFSLGVTRLDRVRNEYIRGTAHVGRLGDKVREARLRWFGHVQRRESENIVAGLHTLTGPSEVKQCAGRSIRIVCHYHSFYRDNVKYWCKGYYFNYCSILIRTGQSQNAYEPLQITDNKRDGLFTVHMKNAKAEDSGWYWCAIERVSRHVGKGQMVGCGDRIVRGVVGMICKLQGVQLSWQQRWVSV